MMMMCRYMKERNDFQTPGKGAAMPMLWGGEVPTNLL